MDKRHIKLFVDDQLISLELPVAVTVAELERKYDGIRLEKEDEPGVAVFELEADTTYVVIKTRIDPGLKSKLDDLSIHVKLLTDQQRELQVTIAGKTWSRKENLMFRRLQATKYRNLLILDIEKIILYTRKDKRYQLVAEFSSTSEFKGAAMELVPLRMFPDRKCHLRRFLAVFLQHVSKSYDIALVSWTDCTSSDNATAYVDRVAELIDEWVTPCFMIAGTSCTGVQKTLFEASQSYEKIIVMDDKPQLWTQEKEQLGDRLMSYVVAPMKKKSLSQFDVTLWEALLKVCDIQFPSYKTLIFPKAILILILTFAFGGNSKTVPDISATEVAFLMQLSYHFPLAFDSLCTQVATCSECQVVRKLAAGRCECKDSVPMESSSEDDAPSTLCNLRLRDPLDEPDLS